MTDTGRKLFIASYRVPELENGASSGGLVVSLSPFFETSATNQKFDEIVLCGFSSEMTERPVNKFEIHDVPGKPFLKRALLKPTIEEDRTCYKGYMNGVKWPMDHGLVDMIDRSSLPYYRNYRALNHRFAANLSKLMGPNPRNILKTEDYHLEFVADDMRALGHINRIGHFSHTPKARRSDYERLPADIRMQLEQQENDNNRAKLACDVLGFQRASDLSYFKEHLGIFGPSPAVFDVENSTLSGRLTKLGIFPASIDTNIDALNASIPMTEDEKSNFDPNREIDSRAKRAMWAGRADITKHAAVSFDDITAILRDTEFVKKIQITQGIIDAAPIHAYCVATHTRNGVYGYDDELDNIRAAQRRLVTEHKAANGYQSATLNETGLERKTLLRGYRNATGYFISKRDGCLLAAFEHVAAQDPDAPNAIVVSREAGAADNLPGAIIVDPFNREECQQALKHAFTMRPEEALNRYHANMKVLRRQDSAHQTTSYLNHLINY